MRLSSPKKIKFNTRLLPIVFGALVILQLLAPYKGWLALLVGLGGAWLFSALWAYSLQRTLRLEREVRSTWAQVGDTLEESFILSNKGWARGVWVELTDETTMPDYDFSQVINVDARHSIHWRSNAICQKRGLFTLGPTHLRTGDPLGLYTVTQSYPETTTMIITPRIVHLPTIEVALGGRAGTGRPKANAPEPTVSASGVRDYAPGDSLRRIHWPTSARRNDFYVRLFDSTPAGDWWIFLDMDQMAQVGQGDTSTEEHSVILAASLADRGLRNNKAVGLVTHGQETVWLPPQEGEAQRWQILRALAMIKPGPRSLGDLLSRTRPSFGQQASLIIITPAPQSEWIEALLPLLRRGIAPTILLLDPVSFGGSASLAKTLAHLSALDVAHYVITPALLNQGQYLRST